MSELNMYIDIVSPGELYTAMNAGYDLSCAFYHGSNKTDDDIAMGIDNNIGYFVIDNEHELERVSDLAKEKSIVQKVLLRITPGIDPHTHEKINTGRVDSKFGAPIETGAAEQLFRHASSAQNIDVCGFHCHIGSQIFENEPFSDAARIMLEFIAILQKKYNFKTKYLNLGGGYGVAYTIHDKKIDYCERIKNLSVLLKTHAKELGIDLPNILLEPGRSIVAAAGITLYTVGAIKEIKGYKNYVSIDGGMTDTPRYALYQSSYTIFLGNKMNEVNNFKCTIAGRCCESGDLIQENIEIPRPTSGDILVVLCTGAYNYSMASNYNRIPRPPIIAIRNGEDRVVVKRETFSDLTRLDI